jgi:hypothetical protein
MENKKLKREHAVFIHEMIEHGDRNRAYRKAYPGTASDIYGSAYRLEKRSDIAALIEEGRQLREQQLQDQVEAAFYQHMLTIEKKRVLLSKIINGEMLFNKLGHEDGSSKILKVNPTVNELCRAIETDNRLAQEINQLKQKLPQKFFIGTEEFR